MFFKLYNSELSYFTKEKLNTNQFYINSNFFYFFKYFIYSGETQKERKREREREKGFKIIHHHTFSTVVSYGTRKESNISNIVKGRKCEPSILYAVKLIIR